MMLLLVFQKVGYLNSSLLVLYIGLVYMARRLALRSQRADASIFWDVSWRKFERVLDRSRLDNLLSLCLVVLQKYFL